MRRPSLIIFLLLIVLVVVGTWLVGAMLAAAFKGPIAEPVSWTNGDVELEGSLYWPEGDAPHAAAVFIPGYGDWTRDEQLFRVHAKRMAERGIALLIYDKRGCGESTGDWRRASLAELAEDALGGLRVLRNQEWVDPKRIGLFGTSQGGAIAVIAASRSSDVSFVATLSMSTRSPAEHDNFIVGAKLRKKGYGEEEITRAVGLHRFRRAVGAEQQHGPVADYGHLGDQVAVEVADGGKSIAAPRDQHTAVCLVDAAPGDDLQEAVQIDVCGGRQRTDPVVAPPCPAPDPVNAAVVIVDHVTHDHLAEAVLVEIGH